MLYSIQGAMASRSTILRWAEVQEPWGVGYVFVVELQLHFVVDCLSRGEGGLEAPVCQLAYSALYSSFIHYDFHAARSSCRCINLNIFSFLAVLLRT